MLSQLKAEEYFPNLDEQHIKKGQRQTDQAFPQTHHLLMSLMDPDREGIHQTKRKQSLPHYQG